jgi:hypothetical protein
MLMNGWTMTGNSEGMSISNGVGGVINFDIVVKTRRGDQCGQHGQGHIDEHQQGARSTWALQQGCHT